MSWDSRQRRERTRERMAISVLSLLILLVLLGGYVFLRASQEPIGKLTTISTSEVTISINEAQPAPAASEAEAAPSPTQAPARASGNRGPSLTTEVLGSSEDPNASVSNRPNISTSPASGAAGQQASAQATGTPSAATSTARTGIVPPGSSSGDNSEGGQPQPTNTAPPAMTSTLPAGGTTQVPAATATRPPATATSVPATATAVPTQQTGGVDEATPIGHHSHLRIDGFVGPGAYTTGGIIVSNVGPVAFNYSVSMSTSGSAGFAAALRLRIYLRVGTSCNYPSQPDSPAASFKALTGDQVGTVLYDGTFASGNKIGDPTVELAAGDRALGVGESEVLCMEVFFPWTAGNQYKGLAVNGTMSFTAKSPE